MNNLDQLLEIPDKDERQAKLVKYARSLGADPKEAHRAGECNEERLVLLIYDTEQRLNTQRRWDIKLLIAAGIFLLAVLVALIGIFPKFFVSLLKKPQDEEVQREKIMPAFDRQGRPILRDGQPVVFKVMDGVYREYDEDAKVTYQYQYKSGNLISKKKLDERGKIISEENYGGSKAK